MSARIQVGDLIRVQDTERELEHICTVRDLLSTQITAAYEVARPDGGWTEHTLFVRAADIEWNAKAQEWVGRRG